MKKNLKNTYKEIDDFFASPPTSNQKAWDIINDFYHMILTFMDKNKISRADLAKRLGKSRAAISQMFNKTPNLTVKKMVEISEAIGLNIEINSKEIIIDKGKQEEKKEYRIVFIQVKEYENYSDEYELDKEGIYTPYIKSLMSVAKYYPQGKFVKQGIGNYN